MPADWPSTTDISNLLSAGGLTSTDWGSFSLANARLEAIAEWERLTNWKPFKVDTNDVTRYYDPPGPNQRANFGYPYWGIRGGSNVLYLDAGLLSLTSLYVGYISDAQPGTELTLNTHFRLAPYNAVLMENPYTQIEFYAKHFGRERSIRIIGKFGYWTSIPDDAFTAVLNRAAWSVLAAVSSARVVGLGADWREADVSEKQPGASEIGAPYLLQYKQAVARFRRIAL